MGDPPSVFQRRVGTSGNTLIVHLPAALIRKGQITARDVATVVSDPVRRTMIVIFDGSALDPLDIAKWLSAQPTPRAEGILESGVSA